MKRLIFTLLLVFSSTMFAQSITATQQKQELPLNILQAFNSQIAGEQNNITYWVTKKGKTLINTPIVTNVMVLALDEQQKEVGSVSFDKTTGARVVSSMLADNGVLRVLISTMPSRKKLNFDIVCYTVDTKKMTVLEQHTFRQVNGDNYSVVRRSPNRDFLAVADAAPAADGEINNVRITLYDNELNELWSRSEDCFSDFSMLVTDNGEVVLGSYSFGTDDSKMAVSFVDVDNVVHYEKPLSHMPMIDLHLLSADNGYITLTAKSVDVANSTKKDLYFNGFYAFSFRISDGLCRHSFHKLTTDEYNVMYNKTAKKPYEGSYCDGLEFSAASSASWGAVFLYTRAYVMHVTRRDANGMTTTYDEYHNIGKLMATVDTTGTIRWCRPFQQNYYINNEPSGLVDHITVSENNAYLIQCEATFAPKTYDISKSLDKIQLLQKNTNLAVYGINQQGNVQKSIHKIPSPSAFSRSISDNKKGKCTVMVSGRKKSYLIDLMLP